MKRTIQATIISALLMSAYAQATPILLSPGDSVIDGNPCASACGPGMSEILAWLDEHVAGFDSSNELYKSDEDGVAMGVDSGPFADDYDTEFMDDPGDPSAATISWGEDPDGIILAAEWLLVKDGGTDPIWYLFDINDVDKNDWDGMMNIVLTEFWPDNGAISLVAIYGVHSVPEPGTLALFGIGLTLVAFSRRRKKAA